MTPSERAVIDAARAWAAGRERSLVPDGDMLDPCEITLYRAVRALPRPLSEQLAELRVGAVVEHTSGALMQIVGNHRPSKTVLASWPGSEGQEYSAAVSYNDIRRIISNPEADRG